MEQSCDLGSAASFGKGTLSGLGDSVRARPQFPASPGSGHLPRRTLEKVQHSAKTKHAVHCTHMYTSSLYTLFFATVLPLEYLESKDVSF